MTHITHIQEREVTQPPGKASSWKVWGPGACSPGCSPPHLFPAATGLQGVGPGERSGQPLPGPSPSSGPAMNTEDESGRVGPKLEDEERRVIRQSGWQYPRQQGWHVPRPWGRTQLGPRGRDEACMAGVEGGGEGTGPSSSGPWEGCEGGLGCEAYSQYCVKHQRGMV